MNEKVPQGNEVMQNQVNKIPLPPDPNKAKSVQPEQVAQVTTAEQDASEFLKNVGWFGTDIHDKYLDFTKAYTRPHFLLDFNGTPFARLQNVMIVSGQAGHGKTALISQLIATLFVGEFGGLHYALRDIIPDPKVLLIDTEQSEEDVISSKNRIAELCGWGLQEEREDFRVIMLRDTDTATDRWRATLQAIYDNKPNVIVLDGLLDVVEDFNSQTECAELIYQCMRTASFYNAAMICVLHQNPLSTKLVGHLGSSAIRKVGDIVQVTKNKNKNDITFKVEETKARGHQDFEDWEFRILPVSLYGRPEQIVNVSSSDIDIESITKWLQEGKNDIEWPAYESEIKNIFKERGNVRSNDTLQDCVKRARNRRLIVEQPKEEWGAKQRYPKYYLSL